MQVATGLATHPSASADLAFQAVSQAMQKADLSIASSVLLYLTPDFARDPNPALHAAARAANCTQIMGCSAAGIFTEQDWVLDAPAAVAMVFGSGVSLLPVHEPQETDLLLTLAAPSAVHTEWLEAGGRRFGGVSGDATGLGPFKVWQGGRIIEQGRCEAAVHGARGVVGVSQGVRVLSEHPYEISRSKGFDVLTLGMQSAMRVLEREVPLELRSSQTIPLHLFMVGVTYGDPYTAVSDGRYRLAPIVSVNSEDGSVTLSQALSPGQHMFWALRQPLAAQIDMRQTAEKLEQELAGTPDFGLFFPCMGRGPWFYGGVDRDIELLQHQFPDMPMIGFYGNGEFAPLSGSNQLFQYAGVLGLFAEGGSHV